MFLAFGVLCFFLAFLEFYDFFGGFLGIFRFFWVFVFFNSRKSNPDCRKKKARPAKGKKKPDPRRKQTQTQTQTQKEKSGPKLSKTNNFGVSDAVICLPRLQLLGPPLLLPRQFWRPPLIMNKAARGRDRDIRDQKTFRDLHLGHVLPQSAHQFGCSVAVQFPASEEIV